MFLDFRAYYFFEKYLNFFFIILNKDYVLVAEARNRTAGVDWQEIAGLPRMRLNLVFFLRQDLSVCRPSWTETPRDPFGPTM